MTYTDFLGIPFELGGRGPDSFDCYGLVMHLTELATGKRPPDYGVSGDAARIGAMMACARVYWKKLDGPKPGCCVLFRMGRHINHCGYVIDANRFIHAWDKTGGVTIERLSDWEKSKRIFGFYEYQHAE
ncbi:C40 family peptidase [Burkholderia vietnamiensis]|uniref:C40 family peptidase n=1 Tax=Burkholderia vietnamiensis TaxID=60552 RepID=UPI001CAB01A2|nr:NlpC/P60 family protein [Burkholderia vietnamiensis]CAG9228904.1 NLPC_P60 domain-containing protein [Burkholderia vietnamiensis]HDR9086352.1 C40 family peptidase [Burkholderia vietnamiensis]